MAIEVVKVPNGVFEVTEIHTLRLEVVEILPSRLEIVEVVRGRFDVVEIVHRGLPGETANYSLVTIQPTEIINNRISLPDRPQGGVLLNMALVFDTLGILSEYNEISVQEENGFHYACFNEASPVAGLGVVSYLRKEVV